MLIHFMYFQTFIMLMTVSNKPWSEPKNDKPVDVTKFWYAYDCFTTVIKTIRCCKLNQWGSKRSMLNELRIFYDGIPMLRSDLMMPFQAIRQSPRIANYTNQRILIFLWVITANTVTLCWFFKNPTIVIKKIVGISKFNPFEIFPVLSGLFLPTCLIT